MAVALTADAGPVRFLLSICASRVSNPVLLDGGSSARCDLDLVLCAGVVALIRSFVVDLYCFFPFTLGTSDCSTLGTTGVNTFETNWVACVIDIVWRGSLLVMFSGTLETDGTDAFVVGVTAMNGLCGSALSVNQTSCYIPSEPFLLPKFLMDLVQSDISAITLSACVMVGRVIFLWLNCPVSVNRSLLVVFIWHRCIQ